MSEGTTEKAKLPEMEVKTNNEMLITVKGEEGRVYRFMMPFHAPLPECYNAAVNAANEVARIFNEAIEAQKKREEEEKDAEETTVEEGAGEDTEVSEVEEDEDDEEVEEVVEEIVEEIEE